MMTSYKSKFNKLFDTVCTVLCPWCAVCGFVLGSWKYQSWVILVFITRSSFWQTNVNSSQTLTLNQERNNNTFAMMTMKMSNSNTVINKGLDSNIIKKL